MSAPFLTFSNNVQVCWLLVTMPRGQKRQHCSLQPSSMEVCHLSLYNPPLFLSVIIQAITWFLHCQVSTFHEAIFKVILGKVSGSKTTSFPLFFCVTVCQRVVYISHTVCHLFSITDLFFFEVPKKQSITCQACQVISNIDR